MHGLDRYRSKTDPCRCAVCRGEKADYERGRRTDRALREREARERAERKRKAKAARAQPPVRITPSPRGLPCLGNFPAFVSDSTKVQRAAAALCQSCPMLTACRELGMGEVAGIYGGTIPSDPERKAFRKAVRGDNLLGYRCVNGHGPEHYTPGLPGVAPDDVWSRSVGSCSRCTELRNTIDRANDTEENAA